MINCSYSISELSPNDIDAHIKGLNRVLIDCVNDGGAIGFMATLSEAEAQEFWRINARSRVANRSHLLFGVFVENHLVGTVQLVLEMPSNQPHRAEISRMMVHPKNRRRGLAKALMAVAIDAAKRQNKTLITLDTRTGDGSEYLYRSVGFERAGVIPDFAYDPDGQTLHATTYMYRYL